MKPLQLLSLLAILILGCTMEAFSQNRIVKDAENPESEIHAAINPLDSNNIVVGVMGISNVYELSIYYTKDFGMTWTKSSYNGIPAGHLQAADPVLSYDMAGNVYLVHLAVRASDEIAETILAKSTDGGATWTHRVVASDTDKPWLCIDYSDSSPYKNHKYIAYLFSNISLSALDAKDTLRLPAVRVTSSETQKNRFSVVTTNKNGDILVCYDTEEATGNNFYIARSTDGGMTFPNEYLITPLKMGIFKGEKIPGIPENLYNCPNIAIDQSNGPYQNRIYFSYTDEEAGQAGNDPGSTVLDAYICYSDNDGKTWSTPQTIHKNAPTGTQQFYTTLVVNHSGQVIVTWYDQRQSAIAGLTDYYMAVSNDGGNTFTERKLTTAPSDFEKIGSKNNDFSIGEYTSTIISGKNALAFWADGRTNDGDINVFYAQVDVNNIATALPKISLLTDAVKFSVLSANPASDLVRINIHLSQKMNLAYQLIHESGNILYASGTSTYLPGDQSVEFSLQHFPSGKIYIRWIDSANGLEVKTLPVIKI